MLGSEGGRIHYKKKKTEGVFRLVRQEDQGKRKKRLTDGIRSLPSDQVRIHLRV